MTAFDWDYVLNTHLAVNTGPVTGLNEVILEDNTDYTISIDTLGRKNKLCKSTAAISLPMEFLVQTMDDWLKIKH